MISIIFDWKMYKEELIRGANTFLKRLGYDDDE